MLVTNSAVLLKNQNALPACPAIGFAPRSVTETPKIFDLPGFDSANSSLTVETRIGAGERPSLLAKRCVGAHC